MGKIIVFCLIQLVFAYHTAGSPESPVFGQTGGSVTFQLHQLKRENIDYIKWHFATVKIIKYIPRTDTVKVFTHEGRVEFNNETFSLELKNLQKNDSGLYRGEISAGETEVHFNYTLSVLDPVEAPVLSVVSNASCGDLSNVTVNCRARDLSLTSTCNNIACSPEGGASDDSTLSLSVRGDLVICNYSNTVNWSIDMMEIKLDLLCPIDEGQDSGQIPLIVGVVAIGLLAIGFLLLVVWWWKRQAATDRYSTEYGTVKHPKETPSGGEATHQGSPPTLQPLDTILYSTVGHSRKPVSAAENLENCPAPESDIAIYSQVNINAVVRKT